MRRCDWEGRSSTPCSGDVRPRVLSEEARRMPIGFATFGEGFSVLCGGHAAFVARSLTAFAHEGPPMSDMSDEDFAVAEVMSR